MLKILASVFLAVCAITSCTLTDRAPDSPAVVPPGPVDLVSTINSANQDGWLDELVGLASRYGLYDDAMVERTQEYAKSHGLREEIALGVLLSTGLRNGSHDERIALAELFNRHGLVGASGPSSAQ
jgi:hypothetical protein